MFFLQISSYGFALDPDINFDRVKDMKDALIHLHIIAEKRPQVVIQIGETETFTIESTLADVIYDLKILSGWIDEKKMITDGYIIFKGEYTPAGYVLNANIFDKGGNPFSNPEVFNGQSAMTWTLQSRSEADDKTTAIIFELLNNGYNFEMRFAKK